MEQSGTIRIIDQGVLRKVPFLDVRDRVATDGPERGLLGLAFHPDYRLNGRFFVNYTRQSDGATVVAEYRRGGTPNKASQDERVLMVVMQPESNHNGGWWRLGLMDTSMPVLVTEGAPAIRATVRKIPMGY